MKVDVRIVTATHRDLGAEVKAGRFREDLFYRINVLPIEIPPAAASGARTWRCWSTTSSSGTTCALGTQGARHSRSAARKLLLEYGWPGNVRELENTIERAMVLAEKDVLDVGELPDKIVRALDPVQMQLASGELSIKKTVQVIEETLIRRALTKTKGNRTRAAELLEISHRALLYKIKDYKISDL